MSPSSGRELSMGGVPVDVGASRNRIYVTNSQSRTISILDSGSYRSFSRITVPGTPREMAVNPTTNRAYVSLFEEHTVAVVDSESGRVVATLPLGSPTVGIGVNPSTNQIYVALLRGWPNDTEGHLAVIDGSTNRVVSTVVLERSPRDVAVNPTTNRVYVVTLSGISVIDGAANKLLDVLKIAGPVSIAVNPTTNRIYVTSGFGRLFVIDGASNRVITNVRVAEGLDGVAVDSATNLVYVSDQHRGIVSVIDGDATCLMATGTFRPAPDTATKHRGIAINPSSGDLLVVSTHANMLSVLGLR